MISKRKDRSYSNQSSDLCSTKCILVGVILFWVTFIFYLQYKFRAVSSLETEVIVQPEEILGPNDNNEPLINIADTDKSQSLYFWGNNEFNTQEHLNKLSSEVNTINIHHKNHETNLFGMCKSIMTEAKPARSQIWSQAYQEWYLYHNFFYGKTDGIYLDIGAHKPLHLSNTAFFDLCLGWKGICVEPTDTSKLFNGIRSCNMARKCVWSETTTLVMIFRSDGDASLIIDKKEQDRIKREVPDRVKDLFECEAIDGTDLLNNYKPKNKYNQEIDISDNNYNVNVDNKIEIDFISLDVEGAEVQFLQCFPFHKYDVKIWSIEINKNEGMIDELMIANGYIKYEYLSYFHSRLDAIYVQNQQNLKYPWIDSSETDKWKKYTRCKGTNK